MFHIFKTVNFIKDAKFLAVLTCSLLFSFSASAQFAPTPCDPDYYKSLESRAWLEAQREITHNQNLISKPDSVLEYTCFDNHLKELAAHAQQMFSETTRWGTILPADSMDKALTSLVTAAFDAYDTANFSHSLLGGRIRSASGWVGSAPSEVSGFGYNADATTSGGTYACDVMQAVWLKAKCMNFIDDPLNDGFHTFETLESGVDKRRFPVRCGKVAEYTTELPIALPPVTATTPWQFDVAKTYMTDLFPPSGCGPTSGLNRVKTGLVVQNSGTTGPTKYYNEHVCLVPGCHWEPTGTGTETSPANGGACQPL